MLLVGNDVKSLHTALVEHLPESCAIECLHYSSKPLQQILTDLQPVVEANTHKDLSIILHPGVVDCDLNRSETIVPAIQSFLQFLSQHSHSKLFVVSIPQVIKVECEAINTQLQKLAAENHLTFIEVTHIQCDLLRRNERVYAPDTAPNVARMMLRFVCKELGVKPRKVKRQLDAGKQSTE